MKFEELAKKRYSCRDLSGKKIDSELIDKIIEAGIAAPTAVNKQPFRIFVMESDEAKENVKKVTKWIFGAETFLVLGVKKDEAWVRKYDDHNFGEIDGAIVGAHMMLQISDLGLETTWVGHFDAPELKRLCPEMNDYELIAIFPIGYPAEGAKPSDRHFVRKDKKDIVETL